MAITNPLHVPEPLTEFVRSRTIDYADKVEVRVASARGTRVATFILSCPVDHGEFLARCYEVHIRLSHEEKVVEDLLR